MLELLLVFFVSNPIGFLTGVSLLLFAQYLIVESIINDPYGSFGNGYIKKLARESIIEIQLAGLAAAGKTLSLVVKKFHGVNQTINHWQWRAQKHHFLARPEKPWQQRFAYQRIHKWTKFHS